MKTENSEAMNHVVHVDHHCPLPLHVFSHVFCDLIFFKSALYKKNVISILRIRQRTDKKYLINSTGIPHFYDAVHSWKPH